jgi:hypothetical protein
MLSCLCDEQSLTRAFEPNVDFCIQTADPIALCIVCFK